MEKYGLNELREMFLSFFESKGHLRLPSFSLIPQNDASLLLINSGMAPMKPWFTGEQEPPRRRVTTCQKCIRTGDIENIGKTDRHGTYFEMLGNFSFGDYFKHEAIAWCWEFLTEVVGIPADKLYPSIYQDDDEAFEIWNKEIGIAPERIFRFGKEDNFWEHGSGPCGPCSEVYFDRGPEHGCGKPDCTVGCDCDRYIEVWNNVFSQFDNDGNNNYTELKQKNIDTGMGLERLAVVCQGVNSLFDVDTVMNITNKVSEITGATYGQSHKTDVSLRVITDHIRSATMMIADGVLPSNEGRGYVLRRLIRRAARHGKLLGVSGAFLYEVCATVVEENKGAYPDLVEKQDYITRVLKIEEDNFGKTIDSGMSILNGLIGDYKAKNETVFSGADAFKLYDTYGFPIDLTREILEEKGFGIDEEGFEKAMTAQREKAREDRKLHGTHSLTGRDDSFYDQIDPALTTAFVGYDTLTADSVITCLTTEDEIVEALTDGQKGTIITEETPFYGTMGGQQADTGVISTEKGEFRVEDTIHLQGGKVGHVGTMVSGMFSVGEKVTLTVDKENRALTARNHSATHLLHAALQEVLGSHVEQAGSLVNRDHLRFDFTHLEAMTTEELAKVEKLVNEKIAESIAVVTEVLPIEEARKTGAVAQFGEKYGAEVRVVEMGEFSKEFCGGTHVKNTGDIAFFHILSESGIAAGVRRIEALTSAGLMEYYRNTEKKLQEAASIAKAAPSELNNRILALQEEIKALNSENQKLKSQLANQSLGNAADEVQEIKGVKLIATAVKDVEMNELRNLGDELRTQIGEGVVVIASEKDGKVSLMAAATEEAMKKGAHAGNLIKASAGCVGGGGGGRPNMAQAGGKNPAGIDEALKKAAEVLKTQLS